MRERDLRLDLGETRALVANIGLDPDAVDIQALLTRTEGWAAGVQMAALSVLGSDDPAARVLELAGLVEVPGLLPELLVHPVPVRPELAERQALAGPFCGAAGLRATSLPKAGERVGDEVLGAIVLAVLRHGARLTGADAR